MGHRIRTAGFAAMVLLATLLPVVDGRPAGATPATSTITVTSAADTAGTCPSVSSCTLRQAFTDAGSGGADQGTDVTIQIAPGTGTIALTSRLTYDGGSGGIHALSIDGNGATVQGNDTFQLISSSGSGTLTVDDITLTDGSNTADGVGGAIGASGPVVITRATLSGNHAVAGGAVYSPISVTTSESTFSGNTASGGGAISGAIVTAINTTFSTNQAGAGGAVAGDTVTLAYTTVTGNVAPDGSAAWANVAISLFGTALISPGSTGTLCFGGPSSSGYNFANDTSCALTATGDSQSPTNDALLDALGDNGGPTDTLLPRTGSPLIDAIPGGSCRTAPIAAAVTTDQRGLDRPSPTGGACDIGAVEVQSTPTPPPPTAVAMSTPGAASHASAVSWTAPASGPPPSGYQVRCLPVGAPFDVGPNHWVRYVSTTATTVWVGDLVGGVVYHCAVRARYGVPLEANEGPLSDWSNPVHLPLTAPGSPTRVTASDPPAGRITPVRFTPAVDDAGVPTTRYDAICTSPNGGVTRTGTGAASPLGVADLTRGRTYRCTVTATNRVGTSPASAPSDPIDVPAGPPTGVTATTPVRSGGSWRTTVSFVRPDGGPRGTVYRVVCTSPDGGTTRTATAGSSPVVVAGLTPAKTYRCTVTATSDGRSGPVSAPSNPVTVPAR